MAYMEGDRVEYRGMQGVVEKIGPGTAITVRFGTLYGVTQTRIVPIDQLGPGAPVVPEEDVYARQARRTRPRPARQPEDPARALGDGYGGSAPAL